MWSEHGACKREHRRQSEREMLCQSDREDFTKGDDARCTSVRFMQVHQVLRCCGVSALTLGMSCLQDDKKLPTPVLVSWWLASDTQFEFNPKYQQFMPCVPEDKLCEHTYQMLQPLVDRIKEDLVALGRWDRSMRECRTRWPQQAWQAQRYGVSCSTASFPKQGMEQHSISCSMAHWRQQDMSRCPRQHCMQVLACIAAWHRLKHGQEPCVCTAKGRS